MFRPDYCRFTVTFTSAHRNKFKMPGKRQGKHAKHLALQPPTPVSSLSSLRMHEDEDHQLDAKSFVLDLEQTSASEEADQVNSNEERMVEGNAVEEADEKSGMAEAGPSGEDTAVCFS
jgi:hypothetical protein